MAPLCEGLPTMFDSTDLSGLELHGWLPVVLVERIEGEGGVAVGGAHHDPYMTHHQDETEVRTMATILQNLGYIFSYVNTKNNMENTQVFFFQTH